MESLKATRFKSLRSTSPIAEVDLLEILNEIGSDKYKTKILKIREAENPSKSPLKDQLPVFTPTGLFSHRSIKGLVDYNGLICLDLDSVENVIKLKSRAIALNYVYAAFITPSGNGLKVLIKTNATVSTYKEKEIEVANAFFHDAGHLRDVRAKDLSRIQFVSYDPDIYVNENSTTL